MSDTKINYQKKEIPTKVLKIGIGLLVAGLILFALAYLVDGQRAAFNNVVLYTFLISIGLGSLLLVAIEYVAGAVWSTPFRRVPEILGSLIYLLPLFVIPVLFNMHSLFEWTHQEVVANDEILSGKAPYLNEPFFIVRVVIAIVLWAIFYKLITHNSKKQDESADQKITKKNIRLSAVFIPIFGLTLTYTSIDFLMSLEPHWFSTIFGAYYFSGSLLAALAVVTIIVVLLKENGYLVNGLVKDHYYSLGALLFAFTNFWAYIGFSQFILIYYANLPEETFWMLMRWEGGWEYFTIAFIFVHFVIPYFGLLSQPSKMNPKRLIIMSGVLLLGHYMDLYWMSMPTYTKMAAHHGHEVGFVLGWMELAVPLLLCGVITVVFYMQAKKKNLVPVGDPKLQRGLNFRL